MRLAPERSIFQMSFFSACQSDFEVLGSMLFTLVVKAQTTGRLKIGLQVENLPHEWLQSERSWC
ncbi:hypothetical protein SBA4_2790002 [Candidatus Sulfopaludibacter sp. SbA4]|nr:hypothetical protein SBA4_2790002 [Candidatus Sulfopaludibacter sp. SbA4]